jgi:hypothetical protein
MVCQSCGSGHVAVGWCNLYTYTELFTDDFGKSHLHDPGYFEVNYACLDCKADWTERRTLGCWCGWSGKDKGFQWLELVAQV